MKEKDKKIKRFKWIYTKKCGESNQIYINFIQAGGVINSKRGPNTQRGLNELGGWFFESVYVMCIDEYV